MTGLVLTGGFSPSHIRRGAGCRRRGLGPFIVACVGVTALAWPQGVLAEADWYVAGYGGVSMPHDTGFRQPSGSVSTNLPDLTLSNGGIGGAKVGGYFLSGGLIDRPWIGLEAEVFYARPSLPQQTLAGTQVTTNGPNQTTVAPFTANIPQTGLGVLGGTLNAVARYPGAFLQPYVGAGMGGAHFTSGRTSLGSVDSTDVLINLMVGAHIRVTEHLAAIVEFKHLMSHFSFEGGMDTSSFQMESLVGGLAWHF